MKAILVGTLCAAALVGSTPAIVAAAATLSPGNNAAYASLDGFSIPTSYTPITQVTILKGKSRHAIEVDILLTDKSALSNALGSYVSINGVHIEPTQSNVQVIGTCNHSVSCSLPAQFWADIDQLEAANPGLFVGQQLVITAYGIVGGPASTNGAMSVRARMVKK